MSRLESKIKFVKVKIIKKFTEAFKEGEVCTVAESFAKDFLLPRGYAELVDEASSTESKEENSVEDIKNDSDAAG